MMHRVKGQRSPRVCTAEAVCGCGEEKGVVIGKREPGEEPTDRPLRECSWVISASVNSRRTGSLLHRGADANGQRDNMKLEREGRAGGGEGRGGRACVGCSLSTYVWLASEVPWQP